MSWKERLFDRPLKRPIDERIRREIEADFERRRSQIPSPLTLRWNDDGSSFTISSKWADFFVRFTPDRLVVDAELSLAAKMFATDENRQQVVRFIDEMADELDLCSKPTEDAIAPEHHEPRSAADASGPPASEFALRSEYHAGPLSHERKRFDVFLIDSGWNTPVSKQVRARLPMIHEYQSQDSLYILTPEQSIRVLKQAPEAIGHDPIILVYDCFATRWDAASHYRGFRLNLGLIRHPEQAIFRLQEFLRFIAAHRAARDLDHQVQRELHRQGFDGMVKILRETSVELL